jgi:hypothetical protein
MMTVSPKLSPNATSYRLITCLCGHRLLIEQFVVELPKQEKKIINLFLSKKIINCQQQTNAFYYQNGAGPDRSRLASA